jgi:hypothetical protein
MPLRFTVRDLFWLILAIALFLGAWSFIWDSNRTNVYSPLSDNAGFLVSVNLALLALATCVARYGGPTIWRFAIGYAVFGWLFLAFVLRGGYALEGDFSQRWMLAKYAMFGPMIGLICGIITHRLIAARPERPSE